MPRPWRVLITDHPWPDLAIERDILGAVGATVVEPGDSTSIRLAELASDSDAIGVCWAPLPAALLEHCPRCRIVARFGTGLDNIPVATATRLGIPVTYVPDYCVTEVADHTWALILAMLRGLCEFDRSLKSGNYDPNRFIPRRLSGLTLGLIGFGQIGRAVADRALSAGMKILATSRSMASHGRPVTMVPIDTLLTASDVVSLHAPLTDETRHLVNADRLAMMRPSACLVNTSRGPLIDAAALRRALDSHQIAAAALDVFDPEPPVPDDPLVLHPRVIATPHIGFRSVESIVELRTRASRQILDVLTGRLPENLVNPEAFKSSR